MKASSDSLFSIGMIFWSFLLAFVCGVIGWLIWSFFPDGNNPFAVGLAFWAIVFTLCLIKINVRNQYDVEELLKYVEENGTLADQHATYLRVENTKWNEYQRCKDNIDKSKKTVITLTRKIEKLEQDISLKSVSIDPNAAKDMLKQYKELVLQENQNLKKLEDIREKARKIHQEAKAKRQEIEVAKSKNKDKYHTLSKKTNGFISPLEALSRSWKGKTFE